MARTDLKVPFAEKDQAKSLGAKWDVQNKVWYVPEGISPIAFQKWLPQNNYNIQADKFYIAISNCNCWKCAELTSVYCFAVPANAIFREYQDDEDELEWVSNVHDQHTFISYLKEVTPNAERALKAVTMKYFSDFSKTINSSYWMNHCEHCGMKQGDFELHSESDAIFFPIYSETAELITLLEINEPFAGNGDGYGNVTSNMDDIFPLMKIISTLT